MSDPNSRLTIAELRIAQHDKMHEETQSNMKILSDGINALVQAEVRREGDGKLFERIFDEIKKAQENVTELRADFESYKDSLAEKELATYKGGVLKVLGLIGLAISSYVVGKIEGKWQ